MGPTLFSRSPPWSDHPMSHLICMQMTPRCIKAVEKGLLVRPFNCLWDIQGLEVAELPTK